MDSENPSGGDNQQETRNATVSRGLTPGWICGFVDGEGCFSIGIHRNPYVRRTRGWQIHPTFQVSQHRVNRYVLEELKAFFGVGVVRDKGERSDVHVFSVTGARNLGERVLPFFERHPLVVKQRDFERFSDVVRGLLRKEHFTAVGFERLVRLAYDMNQFGRQRSRTLEEVLMGSSETVREAPLAYAIGDETVRAAWRHAESGRNDLAAFMDGPTRLN